MKINIYQINSSRDGYPGVKFMGTSFLKSKSENSEININSSIYDRVYSGTVDCNNLEDVYEMFNLRHPADFRGHSLSVSDIVEVADASGVPELIGRIRFYNSSTAFEECSYTDEKSFQKDIEEARFVGRTIDVVDLRGQHIPYIETGFYFCDSWGFKKVDFQPEKARLHADLDSTIKACKSMRQEEKKFHPPARDKADLTKE